MIYILLALSIIIVIDSKQQQAIIVKRIKLNDRLNVIKEDNSRV